MPVWRDPVNLPASATVYQCDVGVVRANQTRNLDFRVVKNADANVDDDLTFRADVIGEITLNDGTLLSVPDGADARRRHYRPREQLLDRFAVRARVVGYNLTKNQLRYLLGEQPAAGKSRMSKYRSARNANSRSSPVAGSAS